MNGVNIDGGGGLFDGSVEGLFFHSLRVNDERKGGAAAVGIIHQSAFCTNEEQIVSRKETIMALCGLI